MTHVATLISNPRAPALDDAMLAHLRAALPRASGARWLDPGVAADLSFTPDVGTDNRATTERLRHLLGGRPVDVVVQKTAHRRKRLLVADMDSTMIGQECIDELADQVGLGSQVAAITARAMNGDIEFEPALRERLALLEGLPVSVVEEVLAERIRVTPGGVKLVRTMQAHGAHTCLVSGGFSLFTDPVAEMLGFDEHRANRLVLQDGRITGQVEEPVLGPAAKLAALLELRARFEIAAIETLAVGDGANDLPMLAAAGLGVAFHAKPKVIAATQTHIEHGDLTALLYAQGYSHGEFAAE